MRPSSLLVVLVAAALAACSRAAAPVQSLLCPAASTCTERHYCAAEQACRCLLSVEGEVKCGAPPSCPVRHCARSADCADLGEGYFCDTPGSSCCDDADRSRCVAPCAAPPCPAAQICNEKCCAPGQACVRGTCVTRLDAGGDAP